MLLTLIPLKPGTFLFPPSTAFTLPPTAVMRGYWTQVHHVSFGWSPHVSYSIFVPVQNPTRLHIALVSLDFLPPLNQYQLCPFFHFCLIRGDIYSVLCIWIYEKLLLPFFWVHYMLLPSPHVVPNWAEELLWWLSDCWYIPHWELQKYMSAVLRVWVLVLPPLQLRRASQRTP